jgi:phosphohistidine phosphatase
MTEQQDYIAQAAAIPYRVDARSGQVEVLLIRRRDGGKWGIPKGLVDPGLNHPQAAKMEALQEAGIEGPLSDEPLGHFIYEKSQGTCLVQVYAMRVRRTHEHWDEEKLREREWFPIERAASLVGREAVGRLIRRLARSLRAQKVA